MSQTTPMVIYAASECGFWSNEAGWTPNLGEAAVFNRPVESVPFSAGDDAHPVSLDDAQEHLGEEAMQNWWYRVCPLLRILDGRMAATAH